MNTNPISDIVNERVEVSESIGRYNNKGELSVIAEGFELTVTGQIDGETISWSERRLVIRSIK